MPRGADPDRVAERELGGAEVEEPLADGHHLVDRDVALPRVAEAHRDVRPDVQPRLAGPVDGRLEHRELLVEAAVEVALRERLGGTAEDRDVPHPRSRARSRPALVGHEHRHRHGPPSTGPAALGDRVDQVGGVGELRHPLRVHEAGRLDDRQPGLDAAGARNSALVSSGTTALSFCRPSRGPTS